LSENSDPAAHLPDRWAPTWRNRLLDAFEILQYQVFRRLPLGLAPRLARRSIPPAIRRDRPWVVERAAANLKRHRPQASDAQIEAGVAAFLENIANYVGETPTIGRHMRAGRIDLLDPDHAAERAKRTGVVALCLHTGNWEIMLEGLRALGISAACAPVTWESPGQTWIINDLRRRNGLRYLATNRGGMRAAWQELHAGGILAVFVDEARKGRLMAPLFGRPPHGEGNLAVAAKLARRTHTPVALCYTTRLPDNRFRVFFGPAIPLPEESKGLLDDVAFLNALIEPVILEHLEQWFWLDDEF